MRSAGRANDPRERDVSASKVCGGTTQAHADAVKLVEFLMEQGGAVDLTQDEIARKLDMLKHQSRGIMTIDKSRYNRARNHLADCVGRDARPCCGYRLNYRRSGIQSVLTLVDPSGDLGSHAKASMASLLGWISRERQHHTENRRQVLEFEALADHALANKDKHGYKVLQRAIIDLDRDGTVLPETMAQLQVWATGVTS